MKLSIQFPTRGRPDKFFEVLDMYRDFADNWDEIEIYVVCNVDDRSMNNEEVGAKFLYYPNVTPSFLRPKSKIAACNAGLRVGEKAWDIITLASDDMLPRVKGYDTKIKEDMEKYFPDTDGVLWYNDGHKKDKLCSLSILGRRYFDRFGYIYYPGYNSFFCDNEFAEVATGLSRIRYIDKCIIEHCHPDYHLCPTDKLYKFNLRYHGMDKGLYAKRKADGFPTNMSNM